MKEPSDNELEAIGRDMLDREYKVTDLRFVGTKYAYDRGYYEVRFQAPDKEWFVVAINKDELRAYRRAA